MLSSDLAPLCGIRNDIGKTGTPQMLAPITDAPGPWAMHTGQGAGSTSNCLRVIFEGAGLPHPDLLQTCRRPHYYLMMLRGGDVPPGGS